MAEMCNPKEPGGSEEETFGGQTLAERHPGLLRSLRSSPGCLTQNPLLPLLLFISLAFFMLQLTTLVQVDVAQGQMQSNLEEILQHLTWMNATLAGLCRPCPWNWEFFQGSCYLFSWTQSDWKSAVSSCKDIGAQLVIIKSLEEQKFLKIWYVRYNKPTWIGLSDHHNEGSWKWVDNSPLQLSFWKKGEPNNHENEDCVELYNDGWNDGKCSTENSWICEKPSSPCPAL
ncbi:CD209 antigen isoform X2 [Lagenorhynchus albirostris]|uniref:CD209 antigen isoform X2 n=1 Tax=Lagenorhynchus albirostris TaxID=27610 RepID=UPI0028E423D7|nr:CD209 antigen isoform X2 [Lagenorhynchus albirostris]